MVQQLEVNESFADYLIEGVLGRGGMGTVYLAQHPRLPRRVALKLLNREVSADPELRRRFEQEANVVARLDHPGIVGIHDRGTHDGHLWIAMQYIHGSDAARLTPREVPIDRALRIVAETGAALDYAHSRGVLHRDIKPANILLAAPDTGRAERAVLTDFGIARLLDSNTQLTSSGTFHATLAYASPEQLSGEKVDHRSDQYSLACTLFTLLAGHPPFAATNPGQVVAGHISKPVPRLSAARPDAPPMLDEVIFRAMAKRPEERFGSCREFTSAAWESRHGRPAPARTAVAPVRVAPTAVNQHGQSQSPHGRDQSPHGQSSSPRGQGQATATPVAAHTPAPQPDRRTPSGRGTALAACVLALLFGCWAAWVVAYPRAHVVRGVLRYRDLDIAPYAAGGAAAAGAAFLLIGGAVLLLARKRFGRAMVVLGSAGFLASLVPVRFHYDSPNGTTGLSMVAGLVLLVLTLLLTLSTPTARWLRGGGSTHR
ncbi:serine/threonine protein kinase [Nocardia suismassiliense]|uniref:serine/threonine protein kinase n=1 Tax=Nocardia suismassiliense TaxID=2077092 RepID=UPI001F2E849F|nr:serine/threonine protein kinase [Nocardia suismassiliense]